MEEKEAEFSETADQAEPLEEELKKAEKGINTTARNKAHYESKKEEFTGQIAQAKENENQKRVSCELRWEDLAASHC